MALVILNQTQCPLCHAVIAVGDTYIATTAFVHNPADPLWPYSDAAIHTACFQSWPLRADFVAGYNFAAKQANLPHRMADDGRFVAVTPNLTTLPITPELITLCRALAADVAVNDLVESDDEYQHPHFCGGWTPDGHKGPGFYFSYYSPDGKDYIFHLSNDHPAQIIAGATPTIELEYWKDSPIGPYDPE